MPAPAAIKKIGENGGFRRDGAPPAGRRGAECSGTAGGFEAQGCIFLLMKSARL
jgi:hypothetical protein